MGNLNCINNTNNTNKYETQYAIINDSEKTNDDDVIGYLYKCNCKSMISELNNVSENEIFTLYLCENDIIIKNKKNQMNFIYQNISHWIFTKNHFGFHYKVMNKNYKLIFNVENGEEVSENLKKIVYDLADYYKNI